jgi:predicted transcriptional regulator
MGLTQTEFAEKFPITERTIRNWESGAVDPRPIAVRRFLELRHSQSAKDGQRDETPDAPTSASAIADGMPVRRRFV